MAKYKSYRGKWVDMEELRRTHEKTVAAGNAGTNANGDVLGPGGAIVQTAQAKARKHYVSRETISKTNVSIKGDQNDEKIFEDEKVPAKVSRTSNGDSDKAPTKRKVEKETESGDIVLEDEE